MIKQFKSTPLDKEYAETDAGKNHNKVMSRQKSIKGIQENKADIEKVKDFLNAVAAKIRREAEYLSAEDVRIKKEDLIEVEDGGPAKKVSATIGKTIDSTSDHGARAEALMDFANELFETSNYLTNVETVINKLQTGTYHLASEDKGIIENAHKTIDLTLEKLKIIASARDDRTTPHDENPSSYYDRNEILQAKKLQKYVEKSLKPLITESTANALTELDGKIIEGLGNSESKKTFLDIEVKAERVRNRRHHISDIVAAGKTPEYAKKAVFDLEKKERDPFQKG